MTRSDESVMLYRAPLGVAEAELRDRGSRFLAWVVPARSEAEARDRLVQIRRREPDATHHCWAWRLGPEGDERCSDDGEPTGTAGQPMLRVLRGENLSDVLAVVVRWFGGTKLGKGGLARAYSGAVKLALAEATIEERWPTTELEVEVPYDRAGALKRLVHPPEVSVVEESYGERVRVRLAVRNDRLTEIESALAALGVRLPRR